MPEAPSSAKPERSMVQTTVLTTVPLCSFLLNLYHREIKQFCGQIGVYMYRKDVPIKMTHSVYYYIKSFDVVLQRHAHLLFSARPILKNTVHAKLYNCQMAIT